ncbi:MAG: Hsp70 family protein, partial [Planctomycetes bacterium]|nr:Hsp70 family protein [Planctomycetota bacterium]
MVARTHAVGIDLGTTFSCVACLNEHGEPVTIPNQEGELQTPSVVLFEDDDVIVGREALRHAVSDPERVVQNSKRYMGDPDHRWTVGGKSYSPVEISTFILRKLIAAAEDRLGKVERAVITVPTQSSELQRAATVEAGLRAGLKHVDIINEPVAATLCAVLGTEGLWFAELADEQRIMVFDLGGGTFDLSLVNYAKNEVRVIAGDGDMNLGGYDWNEVLLKAICDQFTREIGEDPRTDPESLQFVALEVEDAKRSLSVRERTPLVCHHAGHRKIYRVSRDQFEKLSRHLVERARHITERMLKNIEMGWAHVDMVMMVGGATRMPMIRRMMRELSGRTINTSLSPDQSIAHGAA